MNDNEGGASGPTGALEDEAIAWLARMRGPDGPAFKGRFERWRTQSPEHRRAYEWATRHFEGASILKQSDRHGEARTRRRPIRKWLVAGAALAAAASIMFITMGNRLVVGGADIFSGTSVSRPPLVTRRGEIRTFRLADGSSVTLDTNSRLVVAMDASARRLRLESGKARISVAKDARPFIVTAGAGQITANQATFDLGYDDRLVRLTLIEGRADVRPAVQSAVYTVPVKPVFAGQCFVYRVSDFVAVPQARQSAGVDERQWPTGWFEYRSVPLGVLVSEANRYAARPIVLDGPEIGSLQVSGRFRLTDTGGFADKIAQVFDLQVSREPDSIHLRRR